MRGYYRIYEDGVLVAEVENLITTAGKRIIADYLAGNAANWAGALAIGAGDASPTTADSRLSFEYYRNSVSAKAVAYGIGTAGAHVITLKSTIDNSISGAIYELGLYSDEFDSVAGAGGGGVISYGDSSEPWYFDSSGWVPSTNTANTTDNRIGPDGVVLGTGNYRFTGINLDFSQYSGEDIFQFCMKYLSGTVSTVEIRFNTDDSNYFSYAPLTSEVMTASDYTISSIQKQNWSATGSPSWDNITSIEFRTTGTNTYLLDGIRVCDTDTNNPSYALVSHAVLGTPQVKSDGSMMEVEYYVEL